MVRKGRGLVCMNPLAYLEHWTTHPVGQVHVVLALLALILGPVIFLRRKGTVPHRIFGYAFVATMLIVNLSALTRYGLTGGPNFFHFAAAMSLATLLPAIYFAWRARLKRSPKAYVTHGILMCWAYFGLVMAFVAEAVTRQYPFLLHGDGAWVRFFFFLGVMMAVTGWWTNRMVRRHVIRKV